MARIRTLKPEIWLSPQVMNLSHSARLLFIGLITQADDEGRGSADPRRLKAAIFGGDDNRIDDVSNWLREIAAQGLVVLYDGSTNGRLYELPSWSSHQRIDRAKPSTYPPSSNGRRIIDESSSKDRRGSEGSLGSEGSEGRTVPQAAPARPAKRACALPDDFSVTPEREQYAITRLPSVDVPELLEAFKDYHRKEGTTAKDWDASWRTWVRNGLQFGYPKLKTADGKPMKREATPDQVDAARKAAAEQNRRQLEKVLGTVGR